MQLGKPLLRPGEMLFLFTRRLRKPAAGFAPACAQGLGLIERLRTDFARVVDAHQPRRVPPFLGSQLRLRHAGRRIRTSARGNAGKRAQRAVETEDQIIDHRNSKLAIVRFDRGSVS